MSNAELVCGLVELLLQKENSLHQVALDQATKNIQPNGPQPDET